MKERVDDSSEIVYRRDRVEALKYLHSYYRDICRGTGGAKWAESGRDDAERALREIAGLDDAEEC